MKNIFRYAALPALTALLLLFAPGCKKNQTDYSGSQGCIVRVVPKASDAVLSSADLDTAKVLYQANGLSPDVHQPTSLSRYKDSAGNPVIQIDGQRYINGLLVRFGRESYLFSGGILVDSSSWNETGVPEDPDTSAHLTQEDLRKIFLDSHPDDYSVENKRAGRKVTRWADSCIAATLLYSDKWLYDSSAGNTNIYIKVWDIYTESRGLNQPVATILDANGKAYPEQYHQIFFPLNRILFPNMPKRFQDYH